MNKKLAKQTPVQKLSDRLQMLNKRRLAAYRANASAQIMQQFDRMIEETQIELHNETELQKHRDGKDNEDGEQWIV